MFETIVAYGPTIPAILVALATLLVGWRILAVRSRTDGGYDVDVQYEGPKK